MWGTELKTIAQLEHPSISPTRRLYTELWAALIMASPLKVEPLGPPPGPANNSTDAIVTDVPPSTGELSTKAAEIEEVKKKIYNFCASKPSTTTFSQADIMSTTLIPRNSPAILNTVTQSLTQSGQFKIMKRTDGTVCWRCIAQALTAAQSGLDADARVVLSYIETAGREGIWSNQLNRKTNIHKVVMDKCIKVLEHKRLIKTVPNYRHPNRRTYMLWGLQPEEDVTGGPFYTDGDLDEEFVTQLGMWIEKWVIGRSWWFGAPGEGGEKRKHDGLPKKSGQASISVTREQVEDVRATDLEKSVPRDRSKHMKPFPPGYIGYPTIVDITNALNDIKISKSTMKISDTQRLVDILIWDGKLERLKKPKGKGGTTEMYRAVQNPILERDNEAGDGVAKWTGLTEAPCGRCPVLDVCEDGGLVSPRTCPYFKKWLEY